MQSEDLPKVLRSLLDDIERRVHLGVKKDLNVWNEPKKLECTLKRGELVTKSKKLPDKYVQKTKEHQSDDLISTNDDNDVGGVSIPLFSLGGTFHHIDSDEESGDDMNNEIETSKQLHDKLTSPNRIKDVPAKLLTSGIYLPGTQDRAGSLIIHFDVADTIESGINCYEIATLLLYYRSLAKTSRLFTIHLFVNENVHLAFLDTVENSLQLLQGHVKLTSVLVSGAYEIGVDKNSIKDTIKNFNINIKYLNNETIKNYVSTENLLIKCCGFYVHDQLEWIEFFKEAEQFYNECTDACKKLVTVLSEIKNFDANVDQNNTRKLLYTQYKFLRRALSDSSLCILRESGPKIIAKLSERIRKVNNKWKFLKSKNVSDKNEDIVNIFLKQILSIYNEIELVVKKMEEYIEYRRERLRTITREKALDDEIEKVINWLDNDGENLLKRCSNMLIDDCEICIESQNDIDQQHTMAHKFLAKGAKLVECCVDLANEKSTILKEKISSFNNRFECYKDRVNCALRLHELLAMEISQIDEKLHIEMLNLAEKCQNDILKEKCQNKMRAKLEIQMTSTPNKYAKNEKTFKTSIMLYIEDQANSVKQSCSEEDDHSKLTDSGIGGCSQCEGNLDLLRSCSCQSFDKSNSDELLDDDEAQDMSLPIQANTHLYCHMSNLDLNYCESELFDDKIKKNLLFIMREMIATERDYVKSLEYVIENYMPEIMREDIPQALRGQRNAVFGNIERIHEFHQQYFLNELENYERNPLKVGSVFLRHESKFYLYALYNKNKPKSDALMTEYGTQFFRSKQIELNDKMDLASYLLKPVQRMGKYALLLQQLQKTCSKVENIKSRELLDDLEEVKHAEEMVKFQLRHGNDLLAMDSLRDCDVNLKEQGRLLRQNEFQVWEGRGAKKSLRQVFLFEELVLFSKARRFPDRKNLDIYIYKNSIKTTDIGLTAHVGDSPFKFEIWFRKRKPSDTWTLQSFSEEIKNVWTNEISNILWKQANRNREIRMAEMTSMGIGSKPSLDIKPSVDQINDRSLTLNKFGSVRLKCVSGTSMQSCKPKRTDSIMSVCSSSSSSGASSCNSNVSVISGSVSSSNYESSSSNGEKKRVFRVLGPVVSSTRTGRRAERSTTLVSQISMESGIVSDICPSPEECKESLHWPLHRSHNMLRKSFSSETTTLTKVCEKFRSLADEDAAEEGHGPS